MPEIRHVTTRRGFITGMGFGAVGLYGVWAAYGAAPLPFEHHPDAPPHAGHDGGHGESHGGESHGVHAGEQTAAPLTPDAFRRDHAAFLERFKRPDGSVEPVPPPAPQHHHHMSSDEMSGHEMMGHEMAPVTAAASPDQPVDLYLLAFKWGYNPDVLRLRTGVRYRLRLMADDVTHGASLQLGSASRMIRLRPDVVSEQSLTFTKPGTVLVYCSVYCGQGHDMMQGKIIVTDSSNQGGRS